MTSSSQSPGKEFSEQEGRERKAAAIRLGMARSCAGLRSARQAALTNGWNYETYRSHEAGRAGFGIAYARAYAAAFGCNLTWLVLGEDAPAAVAPPVPERGPEIAFDDREHNEWYFRELNALMYRNAGLSPSGKADSLPSTPPEAIRGARHQAPSDPAPDPILRTILRGLSARIRRALR